MPRSNTYLVERYTYHLTHRCHNRECHLKRIRERDVEGYLVLTKKQVRFATGPSR